MWLLYTYTPRRLVLRVGIDIGLIDIVLRSLPVVALAERMSRLDQAMVRHANVLKDCEFRQHLNSIHIASDPYAAGGGAEFCSPVQEAEPEKEEYECERGCGFDSTDLAVVEEHEKTCRYQPPPALPSVLPTALPTPPTDRIMINDAVRVQWKDRRSGVKHFQAVVVGSTTNKVTIQFDGTWKQAVVSPKMVEPLKEVSTTEMPKGFTVGETVLAQDPFDENPNRWHHAVILSVRHGTKVDPPNETVCENGEAGFRFWVRFEVDQEANCQWCGSENLKLVDPSAIIDVLQDESPTAAVVADAAGSPIDEVSDVKLTGA